MKTDDGTCTVYKIGIDLHPLKVEIDVEGRPITMEVDTGAAVSIVPETVSQKVCPKLSPSPTNVVLQTYTGDPIPLVGKVMVELWYTVRAVPLVHCKGKWASLLRREWLRKLTLDWKMIGLVAQAPAGVDSLLKAHAEVFKDGLGMLKSIIADLHVKPEAQPKFHKPRPVPFSLKEAV